MNDRRDDTFRAGVGMVVTDGAGRVLALERSDVRGAWQLPQGGLGAGEEQESAAWRELKEETGLGPDQVELQEALDVWLGYELPENLRSNKTGRGQVHRWFLFRMREGAVIPPLVDLDDKEFANRRWTTLADLAETAVAFRRPVYRILAEQFFTGSE